MTTGALSIQDNDTVAQYTSTGESTFIFNFPILEADELKVSKNQVLQTFGADYSITGLGDDGGGYITLLAGPSTPGDIWTLWQDMPIERLTGFSAGAATILGAALNAEFSARLRVEQQLRREIRNSLRIPPDDPVSGQDMVLPLKALRAGKYQAYDAAGKPIAASGTGNDSALRADLANSNVGTQGTRLIGHKRPEASAVATTVYKRLLRYVDLEDDFGADPTGVASSSAAIAAAIACGKELVIGKGTFRFTAPIDLSQIRVRGEGPDVSIIVLTATDGFRILANAGFDRPQCIIEGLGIRSDDGASCDAKYAFMVPGVGNGAVVTYNAGLIIRDIHIGNNGRMGGGFYLKDLFNAKISNITATNLERGVRVVGSVAQTTIADFDALFTTGGAGTGLGGAGNAIGLSTENANYSVGILTPEAVCFNRCRMIVFDTGLSHQSGLAIEFHAFDTQAKVQGAAIGAPCLWKGGIVIPHTAGVTNWTGVALGVSPGIKDQRCLENVDVLLGNTPGTPAGSYAFDLGDGVSPVFAVKLKNCNVKGNANSVQSLVRGRLLKDLTMHDCHLEAACALGTEISMTSVQRLDIRNNHCPGGILAIGDGGDATAYGAVQLNEIGTLTLSPLTSPQNWHIGPNEGLTPVQGAYEYGSFTATLTGCTTSPTVSVTYVRNGRFVLLFIPTLQATSNSTSCSITGLPANLQPSVQQDVVGRGTDNGGNGVTGYRFSNGSGTVNMFFGTTLGAWTAAGTKGVNQTTVPYML